MWPKTRYLVAACLVGLAASCWTGDLPAQSGAEVSDPVDTSAAAGPAGEKGPGAAESLALQQQQVEARFQHLQEVLLRMAELTVATDPRRAALLKKAVAQSEDRLIGVQFETLVGLLRSDRLSRAIENQEGITKDLEALLELLLSENRADRIQSEKARIRSYLKQLNEIIKRQKGIQGRTAGTGDTQRLAGEQGQLAESTGGLAEEIQADEEPAASPSEGAGGEGQPQKGEGKDASKGEGGEATEQKQGGPSEEKRENGSEGGKSPKDEGKSGTQGEGGKSKSNGGEGSGQTPSQGQSQGQGGGQSPGQNLPQSQGQQTAQQRIEAARERMKEAQEKLEDAQREGAVEKQEEAIRELEQAKAELEEILRQLREEEIARMLAMLEERFRRMLEMQRAIYEGTLRLDKVAELQRDHNHEIEASRLSSKEAQIVLEADKSLTLLREDGSAVALPEAVAQMREDMVQVVQRLAQAKVGKLTQAIEEDVIAALEEMIEALEKALEDLEENQQQPPNEPSRPQDPPLVDLLAEIKMIRALQMRVNRRTGQYSKLVEGEQATGADLLEALNRLAERQARIHQVTRDLELGRNQ